MSNNKRKRIGEINLKGPERRAKIEEETAQKAILEKFKRPKEGSMFDTDQHLGSMSIDALKKLSIEANCHMEQRFRRSNCEGSGSPTSGVTILPHCWRDAEEELYVMSKSPTMNFTGTLTFAPVQAALNSQFRSSAL
nr:hypothetical protein Iba_chr12dCG10170 [Ipomoea batatas]